MAIAHKESQLPDSLLSWERLRELIFEEFWPGIVDCFKFITTLFLVRHLSIMELSASRSSRKRPNNLGLAAIVASYLSTEERGPSSPPGW